MIIGPFSIRKLLWEKIVAIFSFFFFSFSSHRDSGEINKFAIESWIMEGGRVK